MPDTPMNLRLARQIHGLSPQAMPPELFAQAHESLTDTLLVAAVGRQQAGNQALRGAVSASSGSARVWFEPHRQMGLQEATFINSLHASSVGFDGYFGKVQAARVCLPAAWASAEHAGRSGLDLLHAYIVGCEVTIGLARCRRGKESGWSETTVYGAVGAAVSTGVLLGLSPVQLAHAIGLAMAQAAGTRQAILEPASSHGLQPAFAARNGAFAAQLAALGATAPSQALEGPFGLSALYHRGNDRDLFDGLFTDWAQLGSSLKRYPVAAFAQAAIEALLHLQPQRFKESEVVQIVAYVSPGIFRYVGAEFSPGDQPQNIGQRNLRYQLAVTFLRGSFSLADLAPSAVVDTEVAAMVRKVHLRVDPTNTGDYAPVTLSLLLADGSEQRYTQQAPPGSPALPLTLRQKQEKAQQCAEFGAIDLNGLQRKLASLPEQANLQGFW
ncbi:MmgE/PrpD family protein [Pseudomonas sp. NPDC007930]|uniref:MmgE/PrpD family protein n=1 Tax=Pseudomonas sp. NPDC007930 TaxID=3364417 RepID=UPI0036DFCE80